MKKIHLFAIALVALVSSCNKIETVESGDMIPITLRVELPFDYDTKAAITPSNTSDNLYMFGFTGQDQLLLSNSARYSTYQHKYRYYTLTREPKNNLFYGNVYATENAANWFVLYPSETVSIINQPGTLDYVASHFPLYGEQRKVPGGTTELSISMEPMAAILAITDNQGGNNFRVRNGAEEYTSYHYIQINPLPADVDALPIYGTSHRVDGGIINESYPCNLLENNTIKGETYYIIIPANDIKPNDMSYIALYKIRAGEEDKKLKAGRKSDTNPIEAGKIYTITINEE